MENGPLFSTIKLWLIGAGTALVAGLLAIIKYKSNKLDTAEEIMEAQKAELRTVHAEQEVSEQIREEHRVEEEEIERKYRIQRKAIQELDDKPLADDLLKLLNEHNNKK